MLKKLSNLTSRINLRTVLIGAGTLCVGLLLGWVLRGALLSPANLATSVRFDDWRTECPPRDQAQATCETFQVIIDPSRGAPIARIAFAQFEGKPTMAITMPFEVLLEPGLGLAFGTQEIKVYQFKTCNLSGCIVMIPVDDKLNAALAGVDKGKFVYISQSDPTKPLGFEFSMKGFESARGALTSGDAKRQSMWWRLWS